MTHQISEEQWQHFWEEGYLRLGRVMDDGELDALQQRIDDIMLGKVSVNGDIPMQLDSKTGKYSEKRTSTKGHKIATLNYRKIQGLEFDPVFLSYMQKPLFREICAKAYGPSTPIACFRAMFMNKPARKGTLLPWHQDRFGVLDRDPIVTVWMALDPATIDNDCVKIIPRSHRSLINPDHPFSFLTEEQTNAVLAESKPVYLELQAGEAVLLHNWLLHSSEVNKTDIPRRAFSVCYMDAATKANDGKTFSAIFGEGALRPELA